MTQTMHIRCAGFGATVDGYARDGRELWFLSMIGSQQSVRALWARLLKGEAAVISDDPFGGGFFVALATEAQRQWQFHIAKLPGTGATHAMLVPDAALYAAERQDFVLLARESEEAPLLHYRFLNRRVTVPLHPLWGDWLWARGQETGEIRQLDALGIHAWRCEPAIESLRDELGGMLRHRRLAIPTEELAAAA